MTVLIEKFTNMTVTYAPKLILAILTLVIGWWIIKGISRGFARIMRKRNVDMTLRPFLIKLVNVLLKIVLLISVASMVGIEMTSFVAVLAAMGFAIGMALQGSLGNFAGGILILLFKPFKVGDVLEAQGFIGTVKEILIFNTVLKTYDNKTVIIPNGALSNGSMVNYSTEPTRRLDFTFGIAYDADVKKAKKLIFDIAKKDERVLKDPAPNIVLSELADSSVNLSLRVWVNGEDYWNLKFDTNEAVKYALEKAKIGIPFPQMDVYLKKK